MYTLNKNPLHLKSSVIYKSVLVDKQLFVYCLLQIKHQLLHLCDTYFRVLYGMLSATFLEQLRKVKGSKYFLLCN